MVAKVVLTGLAGLLLLASCAFVADDEACCTRTAELEAQSDRRPAQLERFPSPLGSLALASPAAASLPAPSRWTHHTLPGKKSTRYAYEWLDHRPTMRAQAVSSASMLRYALRAEAAALGHIKFSWKVPKLIAGADLTQRDAHDSPVRVALAFDGDRALFSAKDAMLSELAHAVGGEPLPYATLIYVWCSQCERGALLKSPRTDRIREMVLESGPDKLGQWQDYRRDIRADFELAFGEAPGALLSVGLMTDTDNTGESTSAWYGPISLTQ